MSCDIIAVYQDKQRKEVLLVEYKIESISVKQFFLQCLKDLGTIDPFTVIRTVPKINDFLYSLTGVVVEVEYTLFGVEISSIDFGGVDSNALLNEALKLVNGKPAHLALMTLREYVHRTLKEKVDKDVDIQCEVNPPKIEVVDFVVRCIK